MILGRFYTYSSKGRELKVYQVKQKERLAGIASVQEKVKDIDIINQNI
jgi:hypothetical protein